MQQFGVAAAEYYVVGFERSDEAVDHVRDPLAPILFAEMLQSTKTDVIFIGATVVGQVTELHRLHNAVDDQR